MKLSFIRYEKSAVAALVLWLLWSFGPPPVTRPVASPDGVLASFLHNTRIRGRDVPFFFGLATAPAHVEDDLEDSWLDFARKGKVAAFSTAANPELRNRFWTKPEEELDLAASTGAEVFRLGVDWGRLVPSPPSESAAGAALELHAPSLARYHQILDMVKSRNMSVMLTLFHHSMPTWAAAEGGWTSETTVARFAGFVGAVAAALGDKVDYWVPFNEPTVFAGLTYCAGAWPPGFDPKGPLADGICMFAAGYGNFSVSMTNIAAAHMAAAAAIRAAGSDAPVGCAHNVAYMSPSGLPDIPTVLMADRMMLFPFISAVAKDLDFIGLNYYGQEFQAGVGKVAIMPGEEYSDSGRAIYPDGLYHIMLAFHKKFPSIPLVITENGVADAEDILRPAYIAEHLVAIAAARAVGVPVAGYVFWTVSDNWEWADGYCPKFGLFSVDRNDTSLPRSPRNSSLALFTELANTRVLTQAAADKAWAVFWAAGSVFQDRPFCRALDEATGMTGFSGLDVPVRRVVVPKEWRFGLWSAPGYTDPLSRSIVYVRSKISALLGIDEERLAASATAMRKRHVAKAAAVAGAAKAAAGVGGGRAGGGAGGRGATPQPARGGGAPAEAAAAAGAAAAGVDGEL